MKFSKALPLLFKELELQKIEYALVGGLALYTLGAARTTFDADFMILLSQAPEMDEVMKRLGYQRIHKTQDVANYVANDPDLGQVDFLFAHRPYALAMLKRAKQADLLNHPVKVIGPEDLIGLKIQSSSNDPERAQKDKSDIEELVRRYRSKLDWSLIEDYFQLFERMAEFKELQRRFL